MCVCVCEDRTRRPALRWQQKSTLAGALPQLGGSLEGVLGRPQIAMLSSTHVRVVGVGGRVLVLRKSSFL